VLPHFLSHSSRVTDRAGPVSVPLKIFTRRRPAIDARLRPSQRSGSGVRSMSRTEMVWAVALAAAFVAITAVLMVPH
jgi:hypothetical protein